jgi:hypothetical protein
MKLRLLLARGTLSHVETKFGILPIIATVKSGKRRKGSAPTASFLGNGLQP